MSDQDLNDVMADLTHLNLGNPVEDLAMGIFSHLVSRRAEILGQMAPPMDSDWDYFYVLGKRAAQAARLGVEGIRSVLAERDPQGSAVDGQDDRLPGHDVS